MNLYIKTVDYLAQWAIHEFGKSVPIELPKRSPERDLLAMFLRKAPDNFQEIKPEGYNLVIRIPVFKGADPYRGYTYLPPRATRALVNRLKTRLKVQLWEELHTIENSGREISGLIWAWMEKHGIEDDPKNWEALRQMYFRIRKSLLKARGV